MNTGVLFFLFSGIINALSSIGLGIFVISRGPKLALNRKFFVLAIFTFIWSFGYFLWLMSGDEENALFWSRFLMAGAIFIPAATTAFALELTGFWKERKIIVYFSYAVFFAFFVSNFTFLFVERVEPALFFNWWPKPGQTYHSFLGIWFLLTLYTAYILYIGYINSKGKRREQIKYFLIGIILGYTGGSTNYLLWYDIPVAPYGNIMVTVFEAIVAYTIVAHHLFDIRIIIRRTVVYSGLLIFALATYSSIVFIFAQLFGPDGQVFTSRSFVTNLIAALTIAVGFEPLRKWLSQTTDKYLFKGEYDPQAVIQQLAQSLSSVLDLDEALDTMMQLVVKNMRLSHAATVVIRPHLLLSTESKETAPEYDVHRIKQVGYKNASLIAIDGNDIVIKYFTQLRQLVVAEELSQAISAYQGESTETQILDRLSKFKIAVAIPLVIKDRVIGIVMFGEKLSGDPFLEQDLKLLQIISTDTAGAIEKARLYEEDQLKSEFVSIASHELLTPTAAIEGYLSMILDEKLVKVDEKARDYLTRVYQSARRLSQLVKDLLSVSRIEAGRIVIDRQPTQLEKAIDQVVNDLLFLAKGRGVTILWNKPKKPLPLAFTDQEKLIQVLINLVSNGIKYNRVKGTIQIAVTIINKSIAIEVSDTGMGMSKEEISHLFEKFYRTQSAADAAIQGTGLGLYISKKLIELMGGEITVTSMVGQGSKFTVIVPQAKEGNKRSITGDPKLMSPDQKEAYSAN